MSRNLIYISYKLDSRVSHYAGILLDCLLTYGDQTIDHQINIYPSNPALAAKLKINIRTVLRAKNELEKLGLIVRYYDENKHKELIKVPFSVIDEYLLDGKSVISATTISHTLVNPSTTNSHSGATVSHTTLHRPFIYNKGKYKKSEEEPILSSASFTPVDQVRKDSLVDLDVKRTPEEREKAKKAICEMLKNTRGY